MTIAEEPSDVYGGENVKSFAPPTPRRNLVNLVLVPLGMESELMMRVAAERMGQRCWFNLACLILDLDMTGLAER